MNDKREKIERLDIEGLKIYIDCEWRSDNEPISIQCTDQAGYEEKFFVINEIYKNRLDIDQISQWEEVNKCRVVYYPLTSDFNTVHTLLREFYMSQDQINHPGGYSFAGEVYIFYSFQDLGHAFGWANLKRQLDRELRSNSKFKLEQHRSIMGSLKLEDPHTYKLSKWKVRDLSGWTNGSLDSFASSLGIKMSTKHLLDDLKSRMEDALLYETKTFLGYGIDDVLVLRDIYSKFIDLVNSILRETLSLPPRLQKYCKTASIITKTASIITKT